jgi:alpha-glucosidase
MNTIKAYLLLAVSFITAIANAQTISVKSPDNNIVVTITNTDNLSYSVTFHGRIIINPSPLGFELKDEPAMAANFDILDQSVKNFNETWIPVVKSKHYEIVNNYNELQLTLIEKSGPMGRWSSMSEHSMMALHSVINF